MPYKSKTVTKTRREPRTRTIPGVGVETYWEDVPYQTTEQVWEPDPTPTNNDNYTGGYE